MPRVGTFPKALDHDNNDHDNNDGDDDNDIDYDDDYDYDQHQVTIAMATMLAPRGSRSPSPPQVLGTVVGSFQVKLEPLAVDETNKWLMNG